MKMMSDSTRWLSRVLTLVALAIVVVGSRIQCGQCEQTADQVTAQARRPQAVFAGILIVTRVSEGCPGGVVFGRQCSPAVAGSSGAQGGTRLELGGHGQQPY
jgi:hypothetical protein